MRIRKTITVPIKVFGELDSISPVTAMPAFARAATPKPITMAFLRPIFEIVFPCTKLNKAMDSSKVAVQAET